MKRISVQPARKIGQIALAVLIILSVFIGAYAKNTISGDMDCFDGVEKKNCLLSILRNHETKAPIVKVLMGVREITELRDGYELRFKGTDDEIKTLIDFVLYERNCCTFLIFGFVFESERRSVRFQIRGGAGVKAMVRMLLPENMEIKAYDPGGAG